MMYTDVTQSLALGGLTYGVTNMELTAAYASIANGGMYNKPVLYTKVVDQNGNVLLSNKPKKKQVMKSSTAFLLTDAMKDVITKGTGKDAKLSSSWQLPEKPVQHLTTMITGSAVTPLIIQLLYGWDMIIIQISVLITHTRKCGQRS